MLAIALILAALIGLSLGLLGSGGSIITVPVLVYVAGVSPHQAVGMSLFIVGATSLLGAAVNIRRGSFDLRAAFFFAVSGIAGAWLGARLTHRVPGRVLLLTFGALMLIAGGRLLLGRPLRSQAGTCRPLRCLGVGAGVGLLTGFLGVGGGFLILPALVLFAGLEMKVAIGTSLAVIAANSFAGLIGQLHFVEFDWPLTLAFVSSAVLGMAAGLGLNRRVSSRGLTRAFAGIIILLGVFLVLRNSLW
jgi:uncharacterized membrane protein YfcA